MEQESVKVRFVLKDKRRGIPNCQNCTNGTISPAGFIFCYKRSTYLPRHGSRAYTCEYYKPKID